MALSREELIFMANLCERVERFDDMLEYIRKAALMEQELNDEERDLLCLAYKESVGIRRRTWRILCNIEKEEDNKENKFINLIRDYKDRVEKEIIKSTDDILGILDGKLIPISKDVNPQAYLGYLKLKADFHRYIAEISVGELYTRSCEKAKASYEAGLEVMKENYSPASPIRLSFELNRLVLNYDILETDDETIAEAKEILQKGIMNIDSLSEEDQKESAVLLNFIKDNLTLWTTDPSLMKYKSEKKTTSK